MNTLKFTQHLRKLLREIGTKDQYDLLDKQHQLTRISSLEGANLSLSISDTFRYSFRSSTCDCYMVSSKIHPGISTRAPPGSHLGVPPVFFQEFPLGFLQVSFHLFFQVFLQGFLLKFLQRFLKGFLQSFLQGFLQGLLQSYLQGFFRDLPRNSRDSTRYSPRVHSRHRQDFRQ